MNLSTLPPQWRDRIEMHRSRLDSPWLRWLGGAWLGLTALVMVSLLAVVVLFNTGKFHAYLIRTIDAQASESLGTPVYLENFAIHPASLSADLYGISVEGAGTKPYSTDFAGGPHSR